MKIIAKDKIEKYLQQFKGKLPENCLVFCIDNFDGPNYVNGDLTFSPFSMIHAFESVQDDMPVIVTSTIPHLSLMDYLSWYAVIGRPNVVYVELDNFINANIILEQEINRKPFDQLAIDLYTNKLKSDFIYDDVVVDIGGTLIEKGEIRTEVLQIVKNIADNNRPVTICTGGDIDEYSPILRNFGINWKIISRRSINNITVKTIIDDLSQEVFVMFNNTKFLEFIKV